MTEEIESPIEILGAEYKDDLLRLKYMNPVAITREQYYFMIAFGFLFMTVGLELREDYKNREWYSWKIKKLKESGNK